MIEEVFAQEIDDLLWYFNEAEGAQKRSVRSLQSATEAQLEARSMFHRHDGFSACRCTAHPTGGGTEGGRKEAQGMDPLALFAVRDAGRVTTALTTADSTWLDFGENPDQRPSVVLGLRFGKLLAACRAHPPEWMLPNLGPSTAGCLVVFGVAGLGPTSRRARPTAGAFGIRQTLLRGVGSIAHLTDIAREAHRASGSERSVGAWLAAKGKELCSGAAGSKERTRARAFAALVREAAEDLEAQALKTFRYARPRTLPRSVKRPRLTA